MGSSTYRGFLSLLQKWPADKTKTGRDLGEYLRVCVSEAFRHGEHSSVDEVQCRRQLDSLARIASNQHRDAARRSGTGTASGLTGPQCHEVMNNEFLQQLENMEKGWMQRATNSLRGNK